MNLSKKMKGSKLRIIISALSEAIIFTLVAAVSTATPLIGANEAISQIEKSIGGEKQDTDPSKAEGLMKDILKFKAERSKLSPNEAADAWLKLYDRFWTLPQAELMTTKELNRAKPGGENKLSVDGLISALPTPSAWDALKKHVLSRPSGNKGQQENALRILVYYLTLDGKNLDKSIAEFRTAAQTNGNGTNYTIKSLRLDTSALTAAKGEKAVVDAFGSYLNALQNDRPEGLLTVNVPDLVTLSGEKRATSLILKALAIPGLTLRVPSGERTQELAKRVVKANAGKLIEPQWQLVTGIRDLELFEAIAGRFPDKDKKNSQGTAAFQNQKERRYDFGAVDEGKRRAKIFYTMGLIAANRVNEAIEQAKRMEPDDFTSGDFEKTWEAFETLRYADGLGRFCSGLLAERPEFPLWAKCGLAVASGDARQNLISIAEAAAHKPGLNIGARLRIEERTIDLLLAMDRPDEAIKVINRIIKVDAGKEPQAEQQTVRMVKYRASARMCVLGKLLNQVDMIRQGGDLALTLIRESGQGLTNNSWDESSAVSSVNSVIDTLLDAGEYSRAEIMVLALIQASLASPQMNRFPNKNDMAASGMLAGDLARLAEVYDRAGRPDDVLRLLDRSPWWGAHDLLLVLESGQNLAPIAAKALHRTGRDAEATEILKEYLYSKPGDDSAYQILVDISGASLIPWLDRLYERDRFEERPLIWKAYLLKQQGKLEEAEAVARRSIKIDPTDGEERAGDRGRAYVVLAQIVRERKKKDDAAFFERIVSSVRIAEEGDAYTKAGLLTRSLTYYEKAAVSFADAYCVQWRLAERLSAMGDHAEAKKHYEIAFERMPEQFGQVANFCFGCEGVFTHQQSQSVAEEVLTRLEKTAGRRPQVQYLLGQLRESQGRKAEAYHYYRKAAELDPDYLDAWKAAYELKADLFLGQAEMDEIALHIIRQDPLQRHSYLNIDEIFNQKGLWAVYEQVGKFQVEMHDRLLTLTESKNAIDAMAKKYGTGDYYEARMIAYKEQRRIPEPGETVAKNRFIRTIVHYLLSSSVGMSDSWYPEY